MEVHDTVDYRKEEDSVFLLRLNSLSAVADGKALVRYVYVNTKSSHAALGKALSVAEFGVRVASKGLQVVTAPLCFFIRPGVSEALDRWACRCLDQVEERIPIISKSSMEILIITQEKLNNILANAKGQVTLIASPLTHINNREKESETSEEDGDHSTQHLGEDVPDKEHTDDTETTSTEDKEMESSIDTESSECIQSLLDSFHDWDITDSTLIVEVPPEEECTVASTEERVTHHNTASNPKSFFRNLFSKKIDFTKTRMPM